jgi:glucokinase
MSWWKKAGLLKKKVKRRQQKGRKPVHLLFAKEYKYTIGIDIGGTTTEIAIMDLENLFCTVK